MNVDNLVRRNWFAFLLVALHTLLIVAWAWIQLDNTWNDMNPTMLVMAALHLFDFPIHVVLHPFIDNAQQTGTYLAALLVLGGAFWFAIGWLVSHAFRRVCQFVGRNRAVTHGV